LLASTRTEGGQSRLSSSRCDDHLPAPGAGRPRATSRSRGPAWRAGTSRTAARQTSVGRNQGQEDREGHEGMLASRGGRAGGCDRDTTRWLRESRITRVNEDEFAIEDPRGSQMVSRS
jgi:hypothetical protein